MPKYVFDFDALKQTSNYLRGKASDIKKSIYSSQANVESELANWQGSASDVTKENNEKSYKVLNEDADTLEVMADYMDEAANVVQAAEDSLSSYKL